MLSESVVSGAQEWDVQLPFVLFAYRCAPQSSTQQSPFFLLYDREPRMCHNDSPFTPHSMIGCFTGWLCFEDGASYVNGLGTGLELHRDCVEKRQKTPNDKWVKNASFHVGDRVFVYMPALMSGPSNKLGHPFKGPFLIREVFPNGAHVVLVQSQRSAGLRVALKYLWQCPDELAGNQDHLTKSSQGLSWDAV